MNGRGPPIGPNDSLNSARFNLTLACSYLTRLPDSFTCVDDSYSCLIRVRGRAVCVRGRAVCVRGPFRLRPSGIADLLSARIPTESASNAGDSSDSCPIATPRDKPHAPDFFGFSVTYKILKITVA